ncbi:hypothetical protein PENTCL1PPCAC_21983, partial [Pristionchus entomophagus]
CARDWPISCIRRTSIIRFATTIMRSLNRSLERVAKKHAFASRISSGMAVVHTVFFPDRSLTCGRIAHPLASILLLRILAFSSAPLSLLLANYVGQGLLLGRSF